MLYELEVLNGRMKENFESDVLEYEVAVDSDATFLDLKYETCSQCTVTIYGNDELTSGENHVLIEVYQDKVVTYTLKVYKEKTENVFQVVEDNSSSLASSVLSDVLVPGITGICFVLILIVYCIIFRKK